MRFNCHFIIKIKYAFMKKNVCFYELSIYYFTTHTHTHLRPFLQLSK